MTKEELNRGVNLWTKQKFTESTIKSLNDSAAILIGSQRLDIHIDVHQRMAGAIKDELEKILAEIEAEIEEL